MVNGSEASPWPLMRSPAPRRCFSLSSFSSAAWKDERWLRASLAASEARAITAHGKLDADTDTVILTETHTLDDGQSDTLRWTIHKLAKAGTPTTKIAWKVNPLASRPVVHFIGPTRATRRKATESHPS